MAGILLRITSSKGFPHTNEAISKRSWGILIKKGYILQKPTSYGMEVSINPKVLSEIRRFLESNS